MEGYISEDMHKARDYLQKIIDLQFDLPPPSQIDIDNSLVNGLNLLLDEERIKAPFDQHRWANLYVGSLIPGP